VTSDIYDQWLHMKVTHNAPTGDIKIYINNALKLTMKDNGDDQHYFKCGVYTQDGSSHKMEAKFKNIKVSTSSSSAVDEN